MNTINFKELELYTDIAKTNKVIVDSRKELSNILYNGCTGIVAHAVALKIYNSEGAIELTDEEKSLIIETVNKYCIPAFIDSINAIFNSTETSVTVEN